MTKVILLCVALVYMSTVTLYAKHHKTYDPWYGASSYDDDDKYDDDDNTQECNAVYNPGFEQGFEGWNASRNGVRLSTKEHEGRYAARYSSGSVDQVVSYYSDIDISQTYVFEGYYKTKKTPYATWVGVTYYDRYWRVVGEDTLKLKRSKKYKKFSLKTTPPRGTVHVDIWGWSSASRRSYTYLDDISFQPEYCGASANNAPIMETIDNQQGILNTATALTIRATDADNDPLHYSAEGLPEGLHINTQTGAITGMPTQTGTFAVTVQVVDDNGGKDSQAFLWTITLPPNNAPVLVDITDQQGVEGTSVNMVTNAVDADNDTLTYSAEGLPDGLHVNAQTGVISGVLSQAGTFSVTITVVDGNGGSDSSSFVWNVTAAPNAACDYFQNSGFERGTSGWIVSGVNTIVNDAYAGSSAIKITNGGVEQTSQRLTNGAETYQFHGYYKTTGKLNGISVGMVFLDANKSYISSKTLYLPETATEYTKFIVNATASADVKYVQGWLWADTNTSSILLDDVSLSSRACYDFTLASSLPPQGVPIAKAPQFVVLGFDDNTQAEGINWVLDLFADKYNRDGSKARVSFYMNTVKLRDSAENNATALIAAVKRIAQSSHEIGNHTDNHMVHLMSSNLIDQGNALNMGVGADANASDEETYFSRIKQQSKAAWEERILAATNDLVTLAQIGIETIQGYRSPYLLYTSPSLSVLKEQNFVYDCSIEEGYDAEFDGTNFRWPYQLNEGSPGHTESWYGRGDNSERVDIKTIKGLWELPNYALMVPTDEECAAYGIEPGFWNRLVARIPYLTDHKVTGLDYNLWSMGGINQAEMTGILKYNLDLRLKGNRAPFMFGTHSQYYTKEWADEYAPNATVEEMRAAISKFVDYALSKEIVSIRPSIEIIKWCQHPTPLP